MAVLLANYLKSFGEIPDKLLTTITDQFVSVQLKKNEFYLREGDICKNLGFVESGLLMYYKVDDNGLEQVADFALENSWVSQYQSFISSQPSTIFIKAIEPCLINTITIEKLTYLYDVIPGFEKLSKGIVESAFVEMINRQLAFQNLRAEERYAKMLTLYPLLIQRVPQYYIASFLNIAPPSLSRIRKNWSA